MPINIPFQNDTKTSSYIVNLSKSSGKTYRELKSLWDKYNREVQYDVMYNPTKYINFGKNDLYTEVGRRLEEFLNNPTGAITQEIEQADVNQAEETFGNNIEQNLEQPPAEQPIEGEQPTEGSPENTGESVEEGEQVTMSDDENSQMPTEDEVDAMFAEFDI